jgi:hypothetical protein
MLFTMALARRCFPQSRHRGKSLHSHRCTAEVAGSHRLPHLEEVQAWETYSAFGHHYSLQDGFRTEDVVGGTVRDILGGQEGMPAAAAACYRLVVSHTGCFPGGHRRQLHYCCSGGLLAVVVVAVGAGGRCSRRCTKEGCFGAEEPLLRWRRPLLIQLAAWWWWPPQQRVVEIDEPQSLESPGQLMGGECGQWRWCLGPLEPFREVVGEGGPRGVQGKGWSWVVWLQQEDHTQE